MNEIQITISKEKEANFLDNLISDLFSDNKIKEDVKHLNYYKIDKDIINYIFNKNENEDVEINEILQNLYVFLENKIKDGDIYSDFKKQNFETFISTTIIRRIKNIIVFHLIRQKIVGKENSVEYKLAFRKLAEKFSDEIADYEEDKFYLVKELSLCIVERNHKQTLENINLITPGFKKATYIRKNNKLIQTNLFHKQEFYKILDNTLIKISFINKKKLISEYELSSTKISDINLDNLQCIDYFNNVNYANHKKFNKEKLTNRLKTKLFDLYIRAYDNVIKAPEKKYQENEYRDKIVVSIYKILKSEYTKASIHVISIITGYICAELGLLNSEQVHIDSTNKHSYNQYLNKTVRNILVKAELI